MVWKTIDITTESGETVRAQAPVIVSASRATDIPAFYADWFFDRLEKGYSVWTNPFNGAKSYVSYARTRLVVFWSKNPRPLLPHLEKLREKGIRCYLHYTLNDYETEGLERGIPPLDERIDTFLRFSELLGKELVIWRFDPLIRTDRIGVEELLRKAERIGDRLRGHTRKLVFSFADIRTYRSVQGNLRRNDIRWREFDERQMLDTATGLAELNKKWGYTLATCGERIDLSQFGVRRNKCIDDELIVRQFADDPLLMDFLGVERDGLFGPETVVRKNAKDKGQRPFCGCIASKDIGEYDTCPHQCAYCYANRSDGKAAENYRLHRARPDAETITGK
ncbi:DUF1848 domain-containing protein [Alistipes provencensis]|uniref:DUF1848 domain-containing protein n=1 Tax=Alistipes provencensis TaxID=1816676 RepID=UPI0007EC719E|nr:DUF1848 domain-containing protein [Alistipes provencensis]